MVKLADDYQTPDNKFVKLGIKIPNFNQEKVKLATKKHPVWVHFGGGNLFRAFHAVIAQELLNKNEMKSGIIVAETYDEEIIRNVYKKDNDRHLSVVMNADNTLDKELIASVAESIYYNKDNKEGWQKLALIFEQPSLQLVTFSFTEKGYKLDDGKGNLTKAAQRDMASNPDEASTNMAAIARLLYKRYLAGQYPIAMVSTDNFSQNGLELQKEIMKIAHGWVANKVVEPEFLDYLSNKNKVSFPWTMIDRITPNPSFTVAGELKEQGFEDSNIIHTKKGTNIASFTNTEETHYLVIEDDFPNGRPKLEDAGVIMTDRETVNDADQMKVTACLNPLHTALAILGCLLGYDSIATEVRDPDLKNFIINLGYGEDLPVVKDPKIINPRQFINELITKRLPNKNIPDTPQRIASDTSQKIPIRYGVTIQKYIDSAELDPQKLIFIPFVLSAWCRYLMAVNDNGEPFSPSPDPLYSELHQQVARVKLDQNNRVNVHKVLQPILSNEEIFGNNLYETGLGSIVEKDFEKLIKGKKAVRTELHNLVENHSYDLEV
ncbi:MAG: mannitol dehydrogenase family protein [Lactobacillus helsingborgensis]|nr:mannitol dehydrogenase family protein [Lactobacillus helsingborgensis]MCT6846472.1 mannitol dehydrogenase family protein [Lactobacillus helsingborgensis]